MAMMRGCPPPSSSRGVERDGDKMESPLSCCHMERKQMMMRGTAPHHRLVVWKGSPSLLSYGKKIKDDEGDSPRCCLVVWKEKATRGTAPRCCCRMQREQMTKGTASHHCLMVWRERQWGEQPLSWLSSPYEKRADNEGDSPSSLSWCGKEAEGNKGDGPSLPLSGKEAENYEGDSPLSSLSYGKEVDDDKGDSPLLSSCLYLHLIIRERKKEKIQQAHLAYLALATLGSPPGHVENTREVGVA